MYKANIQTLHGNWTYGWALDLHTISSHMLGHLNNHKIFNSERTELGEGIYQIKYNDNMGQNEKFEIIKNIAETAANFLNTRYVVTKDVVIIPTPPSKIRDFQPVYAMADLIGKFCNLYVDFNYISKTKNTPQLKSMDFNEKQNILDGAFDLRDMLYQNRKILLFDDLYCSGSTLQEITKTLFLKGKVAKIYVLTITKTRTKK
ncbi:MAG: ComF family protein [Campylobacter sp.]